MFGYVVVNKAEMKFKDFDMYRSYYCGLCKSLKDSYRALGQLSLSFDFTFLVILLSSLYEPDEKVDNERCIAHPFEKHQTRRNKYSDYVADMNIILAYYNSLDDWEDEKKLKKLAYAKAVSGRVKKAVKKYPEKVQVIKDCLKELSEAEKRNEQSIDLVAGCFGKLMAEVFYYDDYFKDTLMRMGYFLGKFIYILDAYEDIEKDLEKGSYNPLAKLYGTDGFENTCREYLVMMMSECSREFEILPIIANADILRNILYSGVWTRYELARTKREDKKKIKEN